ncbi:hypothetical protein F2Q69_00053609 [Brassica cretica]|uniref:Uncharacterized protein n=1 Tax=Brassica cretica TaxID=69181 RepID=A0A8S9MZA6_BRACR|nr:hypothetical protein F2Q69_00053609 [Brassica cretica]
MQLLQFNLAQGRLIGSRTGVKLINYLRSECVLVHFYPSFKCGFSGSVRPETSESRGEMMCVDMLFTGFKENRTFTNRTFTFQLKLTEFNFTSKHQSFTISHIFEKHQRPPLPSFAEQRSNNQPGEDMPRAGASDRLGIVEGGDVDPPIQSDEAVFVDSTTTNEPPTDDLCEGKKPRIA